VSNHSDRSNDQIEQAVSGYQELIHAISTSRPPEFPDSSLTMAQMKVLMLLSIGGETRMSDLAPRLGISLSTLSSLVERLVEASYAQRRDDPRDRRNVLVSLSAEGEGLLDTFQELGVRHLRDLLAQLDESELEAVNQTIGVLVAAARRLATEETK
jgi:DNA-binding MarR family transcriptional regulator